ncbi:hypothetical protein M3Y99_01725100 [Aphelenchoides fujianensis]|nr:hypothetical protein M3Y99_01725100 [Aphelenchoides fujianensis]
MRSLLVLGLVLAASGCVFAAGPTDGFQPRFYYTPEDPSQSNPSSLAVRYYVKEGASGSPIIYGTAGRVSVEDLMASYPFPVSQADTFDKATIVYVEQRYFGGSNSGRVLNGLSNFAQLTLSNVVNDHVGLIRNLSSTYNTNSFLVFGGGHGGLIAGYVANKLKDDKDLNVLGWSSSAPLKYLRRSDVTIDFNKIKEINNQFVQQVKTAPGCSLDEATITSKMQKFFGDLRALTDANQLLNARLTPAVTVRTAANPPSTDQLKLAIWIRNALISLGFDNKPFDANGGQQQLKFKTLCDWLDRIPTDGSSAITPQAVRDLTDLVQPGYDPVYWDLTRGAHSHWDKDAAAAAYQDYTDYQILYCVDSDTGKGDPFTGSQPAISQACQTEADYNAFVQQDAQTLFTEGTTVPTITLGTPKSSDWPISLKKHVIQSLDDGSIFTKQDFSNDAVKTDFAFNYRLYGFDQIELDNPRACDNDRVKQVRYEILRAYGCLGGFVDKSNPDTCNTDKIFNGNADNKAPTAATCPYDQSQFPWGYPAVKFIDPTSSSSTSSIGTSSTTAKPSTSTKGTGAIGPMVSVVSGLLMVSLAQLFKA